jgi:hypothetical protein
LRHLLFRVFIPATKKILILKIPLQSGKGFQVIHVNFVRSLLAYVSSPVGFWIKLVPVNTGPKKG